MTLKTPKSWRQGLTDSGGEPTLQIMSMCLTIFQVLWHRCWSVHKVCCQGSSLRGLSGWKAIRNVGGAERWQNDQHLQFSGSTGRFQSRVTGSPSQGEIIKLTTYFFHIFHSFLLNASIARLTTPHASCQNRQSRFFSLLWTCWWNVSLVIRIFFLQ